ncbi:serine/threonine protein kinase [Streptosporangium sp. NPDC001559]|uniref:serine/threonine protein kinase n=1 Tax=Streptosporangium sp. NPDC001559 TaxID=3366187 RepID=UPI0036E3E48C
MGDFSPLTPEDPERIGVYLLTGRLGDASGQTVYLGHLPDQETTRVIRLLPAPPGADPQTRERITNRLHAAKRISGAHTAKLVEVGWFDDSPYVVHEHVEGRSLRETVTADGPLDPDALERLASGTLTALTAIHLAGLAHGGLNPDTVVLSAEGPRVRDTALGVTGPEPDYHAPELVHANLTGGPAPAPGRPADLFAWAATIAYAATGRAPFGGDPQAVLNGSPDLTGLAPALTALLIACLDKQPQQRPDTKAAMLQLLGDRPALTGTAVTGGAVTGGTVVGDAVAPAVPQQQDAAASQPAASAGWSAPPLPKDTAASTQPPIVLQVAASTTGSKKPGGLLLAACVGTVAVLAGAGIWAAGNYTSLNNVERASADGKVANPLELVDQGKGRQPYPTDGTGGQGQQGTGDDPSDRVTVPWGTTPDPNVPDVAPLQLTTEEPTGEPPVPTLTSFTTPPPAVPTTPPIPPTNVPAPPSAVPTADTSAKPTGKPTGKPSQTAEPTQAHTPTPTVTVTVTPTVPPSGPATASPSGSPSGSPTASPSGTSTASPTPNSSPGPSQTASPSPAPTAAPTPAASAQPTHAARPTPTPTRTARTSEDAKAVRPAPTRTAKPEAKPETERPSEKPIEPGNVRPPLQPTAEPSTAKPPAEESRPQTNPYTPQQACGAGYYVQRSVPFTGGAVYQLYNSSTGSNCVVTMKTTDIGKATSVWATLQVKDGGSKTERGEFKYYAGPVILPAKGKCVSISGGNSTDSASAPMSNCG